MGHLQHSHQANAFVVSGRDKCVLKTIYLINQIYSGLSAEPKINFQSAWILNIVSGHLNNYILRKR